jgi:hypothetical protein
MVLSVPPNDRIRGQNSSLEPESVGFGRDVGLADAAALAGVLLS